MKRRPETWAIRDALTDALPRYRRTDTLENLPRYPRTGPQLFDAVIAELGHIEERRLWRALGWLVQRGIAVRLAPQYCNKSALEDAGYLRGTGVEYPQDARERAQVELTMAGRCRGCYRTGFDPDWLAGQDGRCRPCFLERHNHWQQKRYTILTDAGICPCGRDEPEPGCTRCRFCQEQSMKRYYEKRSPDTAAQFIARYRARRAA